METENVNVVELPQPPENPVEEGIVVPQEPEK